MTIDGPAGGFALPYEAIDHTADLAYIARGRTHEELFENAARGLMALLLDPISIEPRETDEITVAGIDLEECLVNWLNELLFREETRQRVYREFEVTFVGVSAMRARCRGESLDRTRHAILTDIKAATYHDLRFEQVVAAAGTYLEVRIVLDI